MTAMDRRAELDLLTAEHIHGYRQLAEERAIPAAVRVAFRRLLVEVDRLRETYAPNGVDGSVAPRTPRLNWDGSEAKFGQLWLALQSDWADEHTRIPPFRTICVGNFFLGCLSATTVEEARLDAESALADRLRECAEALGYRMVPMA